MTIDSQNPMTGREIRSVLAKKTARFSLFIANYAPILSLRMLTDDAKTNSQPDSRTVLYYNILRRFIWRFESTYFVMISRIL